MSTKAMEMRLTKIEQQVGNTALARLSDQALDARICAALYEFSQPYDGDLVAIRDALALGPDPEDRAIAAHLTSMIKIGANSVLQRADCHSR